MAAPKRTTAHKQAMGGGQGTSRAERIGASQLALAAMAGTHRVSRRPSAGTSAAAPRPTRFPHAKCCRVARAARACGGGGRRCNRAGDDGAVGGGRHAAEGTCPRTIMTLRVPGSAGMAPADRSRHARAWLGRDRRGLRPCRDGRGRSRPGLPRPHPACAGVAGPQPAPGWLGTPRPRRLHLAGARVRRPAVTASFGSPATRRGASGSHMRPGKVRDGQGRRRSG